MGLFSLETELDLQKHAIYGWEPAKDLAVVWNIILALRSSREDGKRKLPLVYVNPIRGLDDTYHLNRKAYDSTFKIKSGGHNRTIAHMIEDVPLPVRLFLLPTAIEHDSYPIADFIESPLGEGLKSKNNQFVYAAGTDLPHDYKYYKYMPEEEDLAYMRERIEVFRAAKP